MEVYVITYDNEMNEDHDQTNEVSDVCATLKVAQDRCARWRPEYNDGKPFVSKDGMVWVHEHDHGQEVLTIHPLTVRN